MSATQITQIPVDRINSHQHNPRREIGDLAELTDSVRAQGVRQNLLVVPAEQDGAYTVVIGHRRLAAARAAGLETVPCVIDAELGAAAQIQLMLVENLQRADLSPVEEANGYQDLLDLGMTAAQIRKTTGRTRATVKARLGLLTLPADAQAKVHEGQATLEDAAKLEKLIAIAETAPRAAESVRRAVEAFGGRDSRWALERAIDDVKSYAGRQEWVAKIEAHGIPYQEETDWRSWVVFARIYNDERLAEALAQPAPEGAVWNWSGTSLVIYQPRPETDVQEELEREERHVAAALAREIDERNAGTAASLRDNFLVDWIKNRRLTKAVQEAIIEHMVWPLLSSTDGSYYLRSWCEEADVDMAKLSPWHAIVLHAHARSKSVWEWEEHGDRLVALYQLLPSLGYQLSDVEQVWLNQATGVEGK